MRAGAFPRPLATETVTTLAGTLTGEITLCWDAFYCEDRILVSLHCHYVRNHISKLQNFLCVLSVAVARFACEDSADSMLGLNQSIDVHRAYAQSNSSGSVPGSRIALFRVATHLENLEKSGKMKKVGKVRGN